MNIFNADTKNIIVNTCTVVYWKTQNFSGNNNILSYDVASESEITPCIKIDKPLVVYRLTGNVMK